MKKLIFSIIVIAFFTSCNQTNFLGKVSFVTDQTWTVGNQIWSDLVTATDCNKTDFDGGVYDSISEDWYYNIDCRSNPNQKGDLFSWRAVNELKKELCPAPWRVPDTADFRDLDIALGGTGNHHDIDTTMIQLNKYINIWGATFGGYCCRDGSLYGLDFIGKYWSQSDNSTNEYWAYRSAYNKYGTINPYSLYHKIYGLPLRCVRDN